LRFILERIPLVYLPCRYYGFSKKKAQHKVTGFAQGFLLASAVELVNEEGTH
jgi:hypothetical protein